MDWYRWRLFQNESWVGLETGFLAESGLLSNILEKTRFLWLRFKILARLTRWNSLLAVELVDRP